MNIEVKGRYGYTDLVFTDENVKVEFSVSEGIYVEVEGKKDYKQRTGNDITDESLNLLAKPLEDLIYYRKRDFDSSELIKQLFDKLPVERKKELLDALNGYYGS